MRKLLGLWIVAVLAVTGFANAQLLGEHGFVVKTSTPPAPICGGNTFLNDLSVGTFWEIWSTRAAAASGCGSTNIMDIVNNIGVACGSTIKTTSSGDLDISSGLYCTSGTLTVTTFCNASSPCHVSTWYGQLNGRNCTQATDANRPRLILSGGANNKPYLDFSSARDCNTSAGLPSGTVISLISVDYHGAPDGNVQNIIGDAVFSSGELFEAASANTLGLAQGSNFTTTGYTDSAWHADLGVANGASPNSTIYIDNTGTNGTTGAGNYSGSTILAGGLDATGTVRGEEFGIILSALTSGNATTVCHNQRLYWGGSPGIPGAC